LQGKAPDQVKTFAIESCRQTVALVAKKAKPDEAQGFQQWLSPQNFLSFYKADAGHDRSASLRRSSVG
jgi:hypothetical protein